MPNYYSQVRNVRKETNPLKRSPVLPPSDKKTLDPTYLLQHEQHFDPNIVTPEQMMQGVPQLGGKEAIKTV